MHNTKIYQNNFIPFLLSVGSQWILEVSMSIILKIFQILSLSQFPVDFRSQYVIKSNYTPTAVISIVFSSGLVSMKPYCQGVSYFNHSNQLFHVQLTPSLTSFILGVNFPETLGSMWFKSYLLVLGYFQS